MDGAAKRGLQLEHFQVLNRPVDGHGQTQRSDLLTQTRVQREHFDYNNRVLAVSNHAEHNLHLSENAGLECGGNINIRLQKFRGVAGGPAVPTTCTFCYSRGMDYLWTPWRYSYIQSAESTPGCVFCNILAQTLAQTPAQTLAQTQTDGKAASDGDKAVFILHRGQHCFVILNTYPYTAGHVMVVPYAHLDELRKLPTDAATEMMALSQKMESVLRDLYRPDGVNLGMNIGKAAGAGVAGHIHMHILPRWVADANFMTVVGETRVLPETLETTWERMKAAMDGGLSPD